MRVLVAVGVFAAGGLAWTDLVAAASHDINVTNDAAKCDKTWGPPCFTPANGTVTQVAVGDIVTWHVLDGTHTVTPVDPAAFTGSGDLAGPDATFNVTFDKPGVFSFYCKHHGSVDKDGKTFHGMWGKIDVRGDTTSTSAPPAPADPPGGAPPPANPDPGPPPAPGPSKPAPPPPPSSGSAPPPPASGGSGGANGSSGNGQTAAGSGRPYVGPPPTAPPPAPAPRESASAAPHPSPSPAPGKGRDGGGGNDNASTPGATAVPPDEAVLPSSPEFPTPTTAPLAAVPAGAPQGDTVAVLKSEPGGKHRRIILLGTIFGVGAFVFGVGGWKYTHRASKYWPA
jgi:plastocyanin